MKILVTGATGKIGSRLVPSLLGSGHSVRLLVRKTNDEIAQKLVALGAEIVLGDIMKPERLPTALNNIDAVIHLAAFFRSQDTALIQSTNLDGTKHIAEVAQKTNKNIRFIFASTNLVYENSTAPAKESDTINPVMAYPASKAAAEQYLHGLSVKGNFDVRILRFAFVYGATDTHLADSGVLFELWKWHPAQRLHLIHHVDIAQAVKLLLHAPNIGGEIYNLGDDAPITAQEVLRYTNQNVQLASPSTPLENPWNGLVDTSKIRALGFRPLVPTFYAARELNIL